MRALRRYRGALDMVMARHEPLKHVLLRLNHTAATSGNRLPPKQSSLYTQERGISKMYESSELDEESYPNSGSRRPSTVDDVNVMQMILTEVVALQSFSARSWLADNKVKSLCLMYKNLEKKHKHHFLVTLACDFGVDGGKLEDAARAVVEGSNHNVASVARHHDNLRAVLSPQYSWLFKRIGRLENGVKFLVDFRTDILELPSQKVMVVSIPHAQNCLKETQADSPALVALQQLNTSLRDLLAMWFSVGFLKLQRVTWSSSCDMLQKISEYEAVHPVRSWADIKRRVGPYRRCFVFVHSSMEGEPLVVLHTALCETIPATLAAIVSSRSKMSGDTANSKLTEIEDSETIRAGIFYSITSTQRGLQGIDLGNYLIKKVVRELQAEFPYMSQFSTLSPVPNFRSWLMDKIKSAERGKIEIFTPEELDGLRENIIGDDFWLELRRTLKNNSWMDAPRLSDALHFPLVRLCARYMYSERRRNMALCSVANFHLSNGAVLWRINWRADLSARGLNNSCGIMVNYRYFLEDTEHNSEQYLSQHEITASDEVVRLAQAADTVALVSKL